MAGQILDPHIDPDACALVLRHLGDNEAQWRQRVGDQAYEDAIRSWQERLARLRRTG